MTPSARLLRAPWQPGPASAGTAGPVLVSVTEFTADSGPRSVGVAVNGLRLRRSWPATEGAVGIWLWTDPVRRRSGSVSAWTDVRHLTAFVRRPDHARTVRAFRGHGTTRATAWTVPHWDAAAVWRAAREILVGAAPWPAPSYGTGRSAR
ncbi:hypothetical protein ABII15_29825 [Streptomyces sp. HUAS MG91]|uniref:DUF3291 domain-containing protein n=1 Tax=Streptomyces tabacisoli TaxID=3156398 RepID=A0AAU8J0W9_9ACTN